MTTTMMPAMTRTNDDDEDVDAIIPTTRERTSEGPSRSWRASDPVPTRRRSLPRNVGDGGSWERPPPGSEPSPGSPSTAAGGRNGKARTRWYPFRCRPAFRERKDERNQTTQFGYLPLKKRPMSVVVVLVSLAVERRSAATKAVGGGVCHCGSRNRSAAPRRRTKLRRAGNRTPLDHSGARACVLQREREREGDSIGVSRTLPEPHTDTTGTGCSRSVG
mmetsp:Transcript_13435/g.31631  ORF Transcript_13435/g.31631 Transcript_13435/m.31631 type:complete len:219 (-) Transcript_13435:99-755(-)